jgi:hypothetical protein
MGYDESLVGSVLGSGASKIVHEYGADCVIKFPVSRDGCQDEIIMEALKWEQIKGTANEDMFAEVVAYDPHGEWLIMRRADAICANLEDDEIVNLGIFFNVDFWDEAEALGVHDAHDGNIGIFDNVPKIIDYSFYEGSYTKLVEYSKKLGRQVGEVYMYT